MLKNFFWRNHAKITLFVLIFGLLVGMRSFAQIEQTDPMGNYVGTSEAPPIDITKSSAYDFKNAMHNFSVRIQKQFKTLQGHAYTIAKGSAVQGLATTLAWTLGVIALALPGFKLVLGGGDSAMEEFLTALLMVGIFSAFLVNDNYIRITSSISEQLASLSTSFSGKAEGPIEAMTTMIGAIINGNLENIPSGWDMIGNIKLFIMALIMLLFAFFFGTIALLFVIIYVNVGNVLMAIAIALGPIFVAMGVWKVTRPFFEKWLNFFLIAGMYQVVGMLLITLIALSAIVPVGASETFWSGTANMLYGVLMMILLAYMSSMIPDIANALMPGNIAGMGGIGNTAAKGGKTLAKNIVKSKS